MGHVFVAFYFSFPLSVFAFFPPHLLFSRFRKGKVFLLSRSIDAWHAYLLWRTQKEGKVRISVFLSANTPQNHTLFLLGRKVFSPMWQTRLCEGGGRRGERGENGLGKHGSGNMQASSWNSLRQVVPGIKFAIELFVKKIEEIRTIRLTNSAPLCVSVREAQLYFNICWTCKKWHCSSAHTLFSSTHQLRKQRERRRENDRSSLFCFPDFISAV